MKENFSDGFGAAMLWLKKSWRVILTAAALAVCVAVLALTLVWYVRDFREKCAAPVSSAVSVFSESDS